jgi:hypothetical protein
LKKKSKLSQLTSTHNIDRTIPKKLINLKNFKKKVNGLVMELSRRALELCDDWSNLKQSFKIPKKQRIEERREHERQLNLNSSTTAAIATANTGNSHFDHHHHHHNHHNSASEFNSTSLSPNSEHRSTANTSRIPSSTTAISSGRFNNQSHQPYKYPVSPASHHHHIHHHQQLPYQRHQYRNPSVDVSAAAVSASVLPSSSIAPGSPHHGYQQPPQPTSTTVPQQQPVLTKEQRRQLFEQKVREEEERAAKAVAAAAAAAAAALTTPVGPTIAVLSTAMSNEQPRQELQWIYDHQTSQWVQCLVPVTQTVHTNHHQYPVVLPQYQQPGNQQQMTTAQAWVIVPIKIDFQLKSIAIIMAMVMPF